MEIEGIGHFILVFKRSLYLTHNDVDEQSPCP